MKNISPNILKAFSAAAFAAMLSTTAHAQLISYSFETTNAGVPVAPLYGPSSTDKTAPATYSASDLGYGPGLTVDTQFGLMANTPDDSSLADAVADSAYFEFAVTPTAGNALNLSSVDFSGARFTNSAGPTTFVLESSVSGGESLGSFTIPAGYTVTNGVPVPLSSSQFSNLTSTTTFYLYLYGGSAEQAGFFDATAGNGQGPVLVNGSVEAETPEPGSYALLGLGLGVLVLAVRRRHDAKA